jgi:lysyl-tRNA synthetase class I
MQAEKKDKLPIICPACGKTMIRLTKHYMPYIKCGSEEFKCTCGRTLWVDLRINGNDNKMEKMKNEPD